MERKQRQQQQQLVVVIVESHHHVLEHVHSMLRQFYIKKKKQQQQQQQQSSSSWFMLHFDAHADLACSPTIAAPLYFTPRGQYNNNNNSDENNIMTTLYDELDSTASGIAEWILPLVLAGNLSCVEWVQPSFTQNQNSNNHHTFEIGSYKYHVGVQYNACNDNENNNDIKHIETFLDLPDSSRIMVDCNHGYYTNDPNNNNNDFTVTSTIVDENNNKRHNFVLQQPLDLIVSCCNDNDNYNDSKNNDDSTVQDSLLLSLPWMLDICLDYFACINPFVHDLQKSNFELYHALNQIMTQYCAKYATMILSFQKSLQQCLFQAINNTSAFDNTTSHTLHDQITTILLPKDIMEYLESSSDRQVMLESLSKVIAILQELKTNLTTHDFDKIFQDVIEAIPNWYLPHGPHYVVENNDNGDNNDTNKTILETQAVDESIIQVQKKIESTTNSMSETRPFMITIARSAMDGFTPPELVETLQEKVLKMLYNVYCTCGNNNNTPNNVHNCSCLHIVKDYGEWEGSVIY